jgi:TetR/AcrR family fatty acid metabolism transcriptional regulator
MAPKIVDKEARRNAILAAAASVFAKFGYQRATIDQIAEAAGVAKGSVYLSFASKEDLFYELFESFAQGAIDNEGSATLPAGASALRQVEEIICSVAELIEANGMIFPLTLEFWSVCGVEQTRDRFGRKSAELFAEFRQRIVSILKEGQERGEVAKDAPLTEISSCVMSMIDGLLVQQWTDASVSMSKTLRAALPVLLSAIRGNEHD